MSSKGKTECTKEVILIDKFNFYDILKIVITAVLTSGLTYFLGSRKDQKNKVYEINTKLLDEVYNPIILIIERSISPIDGYDGMSLNMVNEIIVIIENHLNIVDKKLKDFMLGFKEDLYIINYNNGKNYYTVDEKRKFLDYVEHRYNRLKKKINRPYDASGFKTRRYIRNIYYKVRSKIKFILRKLK